MKRWAFDGRTLSESVAVYDPDTIHAKFEAEGFRVSEYGQSFHLSDGRARRLRAFELSRIS